MTFKPIRIQTRDGGRGVSVLYRVGVFAVHDTIDASGFTVTHVPTGRSTGRRIELLRDARVLARRLHDAKGANWNISDRAKVSKRTLAICRRLVNEVTRHV